MERARAILLAVNNGVAIVCGSRPDKTKNQLHEDVLIKLIEAIKKEIKNG